MNRNNCHSLLKKCGSLEQLKQIHAQSFTLGLHHLQHLACKILSSYTKFNQPFQALNVFNQITNPDIITWTSLISLYLHIDTPSKALSVFSDSIKLGLKPDSFSVVGALSGCGRNRDLGHGKAVHGMIYRHELGYDPIVGNALIDMYSRNGEIGVAQLVFKDMGGFKDVVSWTSLINGFIKCNDLDSAQQLFDRMPVKNSISWTAMISGYIQHGNPIRALETFQEMKSWSTDAPTATTIVAVLSGCSDTGALDLGRSIHGYVSKISMDLDTTMANALMDMYSKSGSLATAEKIFEEMKAKDLFSWTTMISAFAVHGKGSKAIKAFDEMLRSGVEPNEVTFLALLSACSHVGLVEEGRKWFGTMKKVYGFEHKITHYGCMVDLLARAGFVEEAEEMIHRMPVEPDAVVWRSLLSACLVHQHSRIAEMAANKIIELEPYDDGVHVLLWSMYCSDKRWGDALKVRKAMEDRKVRKKPGCSWIEINGIVHEFLADDKWHSICTEIYLVLEGLAGHMKLIENSSGQVQCLS